MKYELENAEAMVLKFVKDFFSTYDKNRHMFHKFFLDNGCFIILGNHFTGQTVIERAILSMVTTGHRVLSIDIQNLTMAFSDNNISMYQVLCAGKLKIGNYPELDAFTAVFLVYLQKPNILKVITYNERFQWPHL